MAASMPFWTDTPLEKMSPEEWESLCDGCGKCCLHKLVDEDDVLHETNVACRLLDVESVRCTRYEERTRFVPDCTVLTPKTLADIDWLPGSCAYVRVAKGQPLADWHHLICGDRNAVHRAGASVRGRIVSERDAGPLEHHIVEWDDTPESPA